MATHDDLYIYLQLPFLQHVAIDIQPYSHCQKVICLSRLFNHVLTSSNGEVKPQVALAGVRTMRCCKLFEWQREDQGLHCSQQRPHVLRVLPIGRHP